MRISLDNYSFFDGGENGIRTHERIASLHAFQACAFNHSATSPKKIRDPNMYQVSRESLNLPVDIYKKTDILNA